MKLFMLKLFTEFLVHFVSLYFEFCAVKEENKIKNGIRNDAKKMRNFLSTSSCCKLFLFIESISLIVDLEVWGEGGLGGRSVENRREGCEIPQIEASVNFIGAVSGQG